MINSQSKNHLHNIEFLRIVFTIIILYYHMICCFTTNNENYIVLQKLCNRSYVIVECFFIISGYFLFTTFRNKPDLTFTMYALNRIFRLGPVLLFYNLIAVMFFNEKLHSSIFNALFLQCIGISFKYEEITWYVSPLFWASLFYFAVLKTCNNKKANVFIAVLVYFSYLVNLVNTNGSFGRETVYGVVNLGLARALAGIGLGYLIGLALENSKNIGFKFSRVFPKWLKVCFFTEIELLSLIYMTKHFLLGDGYYQNDFIIVIIFTFLFICFILKKGLISKLLNRPVFSHLGKYAYSIYVMQQISFWIIERTLWKTGVFEHVAACIAISLIINIAIGVLTYHIVERPCSRLYSNFYIKKECNKQ